MAAPYHRLLSKTARALVAYILYGNIEGADKNHVFPIKFSSEKPLPVVICAPDNWEIDSNEPARWIVRAEIQIKSDASNEVQSPKSKVQSPAQHRIDSDILAANVFDLFYAGVVDTDLTVVADAITSAARALAAAEPNTQGDLAEFKCDEIRILGGDLKTNEEGTFWIDALKLELYVRAVTATEP
jgi:hypothetical protein